ncbi:MAG: lipopolysaccharide biosynthesis protein, partial [Pirellulaceae bacterium]
VMRLVNGLAFAVLAIGLVFMWENGTEAITVGFAVSCLIATLPAIWYFSRNRSLIASSDLPLPRKSMWSRIAPFAAWLWVINLVSNLYEVADRNMLLHLAPVSSVEAQALVGQYHSGRVIPLVLVGLAAMLSGILMSYMTANWVRGDREKVSRQLGWTLKLMGIGFTVIGLGVLLLAPLLFDVILQGKFNGGLAVLPLTLVYCIWYSLVTVGQDYLWCREKGKWACLAVIVGLSINVLLNLFLIPRFGLTGAVWATATSNIVSLVALYLTNLSFGWRADRGVWFSALIPLVLLLPLNVAIASVLVLTWAGVKYGWLFSESERNELEESIELARERLTSLLKGRKSSQIA